MTKALSTQAHRIIATITWLSCLVVLAATQGCGPKAVIVNYLGSPALAPGTTPPMNTPGFWIHRCPDADILLMTEDEIRAFNKETTLRTKAITDVLGLAARRSGQSVRDRLTKTLAYLALRNYVDASGMPGRRLIEAMEEAMSLASIPVTVDVSWALVTSFSDQRLLPTHEPLFKNITDTSIDRLQNNTLDPGTAVAVLHRTKDGLWSYVIAPFSEGWVETQYIAECEPDVIKRYLAWEPFAVIVAAKEDLYADPLLRVHLQSAQMGTRFPFLGYAGDALEVMVPVRQDQGSCTFEAAYVSATGACRGYLPYTSRNALLQAFKLLHSPYGWGGMYGEQDCSRLIQEVFASFGIILPRNSSQQATCGKAPFAIGKTADPDQRRRLIVEHGIPGATIIHFPGHVMLYIGQYGGEPYVIHDLHAYVESQEGVERLVGMGRVVVSNLDLGGSSDKGSFLMRAANVRNILKDSE